MTITNGIILLGGNGTRLSPATLATNKHLLLLADKQLIVDHSLNTLKELGCKHVSCVLGGEHFSQIAAYLKDGSRYGLSLNYVFQGAPLGIAQAINLCRRFVQEEEHFAVMLGDNYFEHPVQFKPAYSGTAQIVLHRHKELNRFGVASIQNGSIVRLEEKPQVLDVASEQYAIAGCYLFDQHYFDYFRGCKPSARGEYEVCDILEQYRADHALDYIFTDGLWSDLGTHESLTEVQRFLIERGK